MSNDIIHKCAVCEADFRPGSLDKDGKCPSCQKTFPTVNTKAEAMALNRPEINLGKKVTEETVRQIIKEELNEFKATIIGEIKMSHARAAKVGKKDEDNVGGKE